MDREINKAQFVLMICTEGYYQRVMGQAAKGTGLGVQWESGLIYQHLYNATGNNAKFIPVIFREDDVRFIPTPAQGATRYCISSDAGYEALYARLLGRPPAEKPPLGIRRPMPQREVKTDVAMFLSVPIDIDLWNKAKWAATITMTSQSRPPVLGLGFRDANAAQQIFQDWHKRYGSKDEFDELRVSIIEGDIPGKGPGYSVHIGSDPENLLRRYRKFGFFAEGDLLASVSRVNRMKIEDPMNLQRFKDAYRKFKSYFLAPGVVDAKGALLKWSPELKIYKSTIHFRTVDEIGPNDPDHVVVG